MSPVRFLLAFLLVVFSVPVFAQTAPAVALPADPLELATGATLKVANPENRALVLNLLERAR